MVLRKDAITVHTDLLFDSRSKKFRNDISFSVDTDSGLITSVEPRSGPLPRQIEAPDIDLRGKCVIPGLVDAHTHIFLHSYAETPSIFQERDESLVERTIRAVNHCRTALLAGYTTYRDLGTEGAYDNDTHVRDAINRGLTPGPRIFCATECLASSGGYEIRIESRGNGVQVPRLSDPCDGVTGVRAGVRRRLGAGADIIKFYADYRKRELRFPAGQRPGCPPIIHPPSGKNLVGSGERNPNRLLFGQDEMDAISAEGKLAKAPVSAHACSPEAVIMAANSGVTTIEHGYVRSKEAIQAMKNNGVIFVPTLALIMAEIASQDVLAQTKEAFDMGVKLACGGDIGGFPHGENVRELELMHEAGIALEELLTAATLHGWEACGGDWCSRRFGSIEKGWAADIVALEGDPRDDLKNLRKVDFVMKDGRIWKQDGQAVGMI